MAEMTNGYVTVGALPAAVRFLSCEPLLGPVDLSEWIRLARYPGSPRVFPEETAALERLARSRIGWVICGGESGAHARPMHPVWARSLRDQCQAAGVPFHFKQWGEWSPVVRTPAFSRTEIGLVVSADDGEHDDYAMWRVGKKAAGRLLDGREWSEFPS